MLFGAVSRFAGIDATSRRGAAGSVLLYLIGIDLWLSKAVTAREKDVEFCHALLQREIVKPATLRRRLKKMDTIDSETVK